MKISELKPASTPEKPTSTKPTPKTGEDFTQMLQEELGQVMDLMNTGKDNLRALPALSVGHIPLMETLNRSANEVHGVEAVISSTIGQLEEVERCLRNSGESPKRIDDVITSLTLEAEKLQQSAQNLPVDHPLRQIAGEVSVLAHVESMKWRRGDYL